MMPLAAGRPFAWRERRRGWFSMSQINVNPDAPRSYDDGARTAATNNLTWAIAVVLIIAAIAIAVVYVVHNVHF
jgi:hypothetical protein